MKIVLKPLVVISVGIIALLLGGCLSDGWASGGEKEIPDSANFEAVTPEASDDTEVERMSQLVAPEGVKFVSHTTASLTVDVGLYGGGAAYLSVYSGYKIGDTGYEIDYGSRILAKSFNGQTDSATLKYPLHLTKVLVQVWFYNSASTPLTREIELSEDIIIKEWR